MQAPLILLPGMMCDARMFAPQIAALSAQRSVMVMPLTSANTIAEIAHDILTHAPPRFALAGLSMGGIVAMEIMRQAPVRVSRLALLDTNHLADPIDRKELREQQIERVKAGQLRTIMRDEMKPNYLADDPNKSSILDLCMAMAESLGPEVFVQQSLALKTRIDQTETLRDICAPTLILCGQEDSLCPVERHQLMHQLVTDSRLCVVPQAGHLPTLEQADLVNQELSQWLQAP